ncbi:MAG: TatD family hydrolase [Agitococcus sp.]|nr:TatD family hydrolase [Moraxellaceae bacterium]MBK9186011.1 TatD family hydrolase [Moraxellaceae bacterium]MBP9216091.1 TatD family hydrolase [Agitococcus sp.]
MWIDTHCHFDVAEFDPDRDLVAQQAWSAGVQAIAVIAYLAEYWPQLLSVCKSIKQPTLLPVLGLHPCYIAQHQTEHLEQLEVCLQQNQCIAVGEIGLDTYIADIKQPELYQKQQCFFAAQLDLAKQYAKPVVLHVRKAHADVFKILRQHEFNEGGIIHAFSGGIEEAKMYAKLGFKLGIGGSLTYEQAKRLHNVVAAMPIESLVIETDAPDMIPQPYRNPNAHYTRNSPAYLPCIAQALATSKQMTLEQLAPILWQNSCQALHLSLQSNGFI